MNPLYSLLIFPQAYKSGKLSVNLMVLPRNINLLTEPEPGVPSFVESEFGLEVMIIDSLEGLPLYSNVTLTLNPEILSKNFDKRKIIESVMKQLELNDGLRVNEDPNLNGDTGAQAHAQKFGPNPVIRKYLPRSYRNSFNFTNPSTRFATTDDEYYCAVKNQEVVPTDTPTNREYISWGKLVAFILRNPVLAEAAGFIYKAEISLPAGSFEKGGWIFSKFAADSPHSVLPTNSYAARIPALDEDRRLFAPVLFPIQDSILNNSSYDQVMQEAIIYNDGFAKIVHADQPVNQDLLQETDTSNPPYKDIGLRLGWDDEQLTIWGNRSLRQKDEVTEMPIDAPLGVFGYKTDVRKGGDAENDPENSWRSQNMICARMDTEIGSGDILFEKDVAFEMPTEVHPSSHGDTKNSGFWLPMYFSSWNGKCMSIPDKETEEIYMLAETRERIQTAEINAVDIQPKKTFHPYYQDPNHQLDLRYGEDYQFRIRFSDISGGGPSVDDDMINGGQNPVANVHFRRNIKAQSMRLLNLEEIRLETEVGTTKDMSVLENLLGNDMMLAIKRPELSYPAIAYTGKYTNIQQKLKAKFDSIPKPHDTDKRPQYSVSLPDPDVNSFKIIVEVKSLDMDNALSDSGKESYIVWQEKTFELKADESSENYDFETKIKIVYQDFEQIDLGVNYTNNTPNQLVLPYSRNIRISIVPIVDNADGDYAARFVKEGSPVLLNSFKINPNEKELLSPIAGGLRAYFLRPGEEPESKSVSPMKKLIAKLNKNKTSAELKQLADELDLSARNLTIQGKNGNRVQFGVSSKLQHTLSPESGSVTFASVNEILHRWIIAADFSMLRDWSWNGLEADSFIVHREIFIRSGENFVSIEKKTIGSIRVQQTANMAMLDGAERDQTRILFLDSIAQPDLNLEFPEELYVDYSVQSKLKPNQAAVSLRNEFESRIRLPISTAPSQVPKMVSVGLALSPYEHDKENYSYSVERKKYLWLEFEEPPADPKDTYFARVLAYAPDPYLCRVDQDLIENMDEDLPFGLNEEKIRKIIPGMENDFSGVGLMQELIPESEDNPKRFLLPLPEGLHSDSDELFGFFTYEVRVGHKKENWSTAQARYGRLLRVNGVQHPAPELVCNAYRSNEPNDKSIILTANHANAVLKGENITAFPPNTNIWYLMYTQVMQADGKSFRNILVDSGPMFYKPKLKTDETGNTYFIREEGDRPGVAKVSVYQIAAKLEQLGLPRTNSLSVIAVEMFPIDNEWQFVHPKLRSAHKGRDAIDLEFINEYERKTVEWANPLTDLLGFYRIYRSSRLVPVTDVCCIDC